MIDVHLNCRIVLKPVLLLMIIGNFWFGIIHAAAGQPPSSEPLISITAVNEPLGQVLDKIGTAIKYTFKIDEQWQDHPVTISVDGIPLNEGLKRILGSLNHAIIYENDTTVRIAILVEEDNTGRSVPDRSYRGSADPVPFPDRMPEPPGNGDADRESGADAPPDAPAGDPGQ